MKSQLDNIQVRFHQLLQSFLNGYTLDRKSKILYPLVDKNIVSEELLTRILALEREMPKTSYYLRNSSLGSPTSIAKFISLFYSEFYSKKLEGTTKSEVQIGKDFGEWHREASQIQDKKLGIVYKIKKYVEKNISAEIVDFFIHGSFSTLDYTKWSDLDLLVIVKTETLADYSRLLHLRKKLIALNKFLFYNDPLQHHGCNVLGEEEMDYYPPSFFPPHLFGYSTSFYGTKNLQFRVRDSGKEVLGLLEGHLGSTERYFNKSIPSLYDWKLFCHNVLLIPTLYLEARDIYAYKKFSFEKARKEFTPEEWSAVERISKIRDSFYFNPLWAKLLLKCSPSYWPLVIVLMFFPRAPQHTNEIKNEVFNFAHAIRREINK
ncbi:nucleotidyltransferase domain-containing protein [Chloroflexota bacterium]